MRHLCFHLVIYCLSTYWISLVMAQTLGKCFGIDVLLVCGHLSGLTSDMDVIVVLLRHFEVMIALIWGCV